MGETAPPYTQQPRMQFTSPIYQQQPPVRNNQTVIIQQSMIQSGGREWSSSCCSCFDDMESCCCVLWVCPCYLCWLYNQYGECCCTPCVVPCASMALRIQHRNRNKIQGTILNDCCVSTFCEYCSLCQLKRDMNYVMNTKGSLFRL